MVSELAKNLSLALQVMLCSLIHYRMLQLMRVTAGGKRQLTLPVQANDITSYFPSLPSKGDAFKQFSAPRATSKLKPTAPLRHSLLGKRSNADACNTDEEQPSTSGKSLHTFLQICAQHQNLQPYIKLADNICTHFADAQVVCAKVLAQPALHLMATTLRMNLPY